MLSFKLPACSTSLSRRHTAPWPSAWRVSGDGRHHRLLPPPVVVHLALGAAEPLREVITMSPLDLGPELNIILGWDWISSHDLRFLYPQGGVVGGGPHDLVSAPLRPSSGPPATRAAVLIGHGEIRRMLRLMVPPRPPTSTNPPQWLPTSLPTGATP